jgi:hypothetical protein
MLFKYGVRLLRQEVTMKLDVVKFGIAWAATAAILWILCSLFVFIIPGQSMMMSGQMMHSNMGNWQWSFSWGGAFAGIILWALFAGVFGCLSAWIYNSLPGSGKASRD